MIDWNGNDRRTIHSDPQMDIARDELFTLIEKTENQQQKAQLLVMLKMYDAIVENTKIARLAANDIEDQRKSFNDHVQEEVKMMSKGQGMYKTSMFFLSVIQVILASVVGSFYQDWKSMRSGITEQTLAIELIKSNVKNLEEKINIHSQLYPSQADPSNNQRPR